MPSEIYHGQECVTTVTAMGMFPHIALTANPDFNYTWHQPQYAATEQLIGDGTIRRAGDRAICTHWGLWRVHAETELGRDGTSAVLSSRDPSGAETLGVDIVDAHPGCCCKVLPSIGAELRPFG